MIERIVEFSARQRFLIIFLALTAAVGGCWSLYHTSLDAIPDLSETQVIIYSRWDRSPDTVEAQVTYPIVTALLGAPRVKAVRGISDFGYSFVYAIFEDGTDTYWARSRALEYLSSVLPGLPEGVKTELGPDATGLGWVFQYALVDESGKHSLSELRSFQDWSLRYYLKSVPGVAEVAPIGGFGQQYQVNLDPLRLQAYGIPVSRVVEAVRSGNVEAGGRLLEFGGTEYMVRGRGYARSLADFENIVVQRSATGTTIRIKDVGQVVLGPELRRGVADWNGEGEAVSGVIVMRQGEDALAVTDRVKAKLKELEPGMPSGVKVIPVYDRSELIHRAIANLRTTVIEVIVTVVLVIVLFLWHPASAIVPVLTIPITILIVFIPFRLMGITANIMSLGGIAIAVGALVDAAIVVVEQTHKKLESWNANGRTEDYRTVIIEGLKEVAAPSFFALLVLGVAFLPVLTLEAQEGRLFKPLAYTKTLAMLVAAVLAITLDPALRLLFTRVQEFRFRPKPLSRIANILLVGRIHSEQDHPVTRVLVRFYEPVVRFALQRKWLVLASAALLVISTVPAFLSLGSEFMPPLDEGALLYMPSTLPGISIAEAQRVLQLCDRTIRQFPEVDTVFGKAGRAETPTDPAPLSMLEVVVNLKPQDQWRRVPTWYSNWSPEWMKPVFRRVTPDHISRDQLIDELNEALRIPGVTNSWTMPVKGRIEMLTTGLRTPVGLKISGADPQVIEHIGTEVQALLPAVRGTRSVFAERASGGYFVDIDWDREELARNGISMEEAQRAVQNAIGGENITTTVEGPARYPVNVRYMRDFRSDLDSVRRILVSDASGQVQVPLGDLATVQVKTGPSMLRNENGLLTGYVYVDVTGRDPGTYVEDAARLLRQKLNIAPGYSVSWSGQYEAMQRVRQRLLVIVPLTLLLIFLLLYLNTKSVAKTLIVILAVPFSAVGAVWLLYLLGYNMSVGVWVGLIALLGVDAETGVFMLLYLDLAFAHAKTAGRLRNLEELREAIVHGAARRIRPKIMTVATMFTGLLPVMWSSGTGSDVMKRIAAPLIGGILTSFILELIVYPAVYEIWKWDLSQRPVAERVPTHDPVTA